MHCNRIYIQSFFRMNKSTFARLKLLEALKVDWSNHKKQELFWVHCYFIFEPYAHQDL